MKFPLLVIALFISFIHFGFSQINPVPNGGEVHLSSAQMKCLPDLDRQNIQEVLHASIEALKAEGKLSNAYSHDVVRFDFPMRKTEELEWNNFYCITNFVDHDNSFGIEDFNCGSRSYDGHKGIDFITWPFPGYLFQNDLVEVVAAEAGTIIWKSDGEEDENCSWQSGLTWNAVFVQHSDGSTAWYGHMKKNSLTAKAVGETVEKGEYLGLVASSGYSDTPHLHFEVYDALGNLIDPYIGNCNDLNTESWWNEQPAVREPTLNALLTHSDVPQHVCPSSQEQSFLSDNFLPGDSIIFGTYFKDQQQGDITAIRIIRPDGSIYDSWSHVAPNTYNCSWWWWWSILPLDAPQGVWAIEVDYKSTTYRHDFEYGLVSSVANADLSNQIKLFPNPVNDILTLEGLQSKRGNIEIYNSAGRLVAPNLSVSDQIDISELASGLYLILINIEEGQLYKTFVKN